VLLVHGWSGRGTQLAEFVAPCVAAGYRAVAFDAPAHGLSAGRATTLPEVGDVLGEIAVRFGPVHGIVAHSFGVLCTLYALEQGLGVRRCVALSPPATLEGLVEKFAHGLALPPPAWRALRAELEARFGADLWSRFSPLRLAARATAPALVVHDADDREVPLHEGETLARAWPGASFHATAGLGHRRILRDPAVVARAVAYLSAATVAGVAPATAGEPASVV
jgi:pimeloyl-ACP methyl ester carboxylesterase